MELVFCKQSIHYLSLAQIAFVVACRVALMWLCSISLVNLVKSPSEMMILSRYDYWPDFFKVSKCFPMAASFLTTA